MQTLLDLFFNLTGILLGWAAFNFLMLSNYKDEHEQSWNWTAYKKEHWDNWVLSGLFALVLLWVGYGGFDLEPMGFELKWSNIYYLCSGVAPEVALRAWKKFKSKE